MSGGAVREAAGSSCCRKGTCAFGSPEFAAYLDELHRTLISWMKDVIWDAPRNMRLVQVLRLRE